MVRLLTNLIVQKVGSKMKSKIVNYSINKDILCLIAFILVLFFSLPTWADTYYIDYSNGSDANNGVSKSTPWKRSPGMVGFSGNYTHSAGDIFVFKGGERWTSAELPLQIIKSGSAGNIDTYTVDVSWYTGGSWKRPIFDLENTDVIGIDLKSARYITIDNIMIINPADMSTYNGALIRSGQTTENIEIQNCFLDCSGGSGDCWPLYLRDIDTIKIDKNFIRAKQDNINPDGILLRPWSSLKNITISNNEITSPDGTGGDGIHIDAEINGFGGNFLGNYGPILIESNNFHDMAGKMFISIISGGHDVTIRYNQFHGMQNNRIAIDFDGAANGSIWFYDSCKVYYNHFYKLTGNVANWGGLIRVVKGDKAGSQNNFINNNTFYQDGSYPDYEIGIKFTSHSGTSWDVKNNIFYGLTTGIQNAGGANVKNNLFYNNKWNGTTGTNYITASPKLNNISQNGYSLQTDSPCIDTGLDWTQSRDFLGNSKSGSKWEIGAIEMNLLAPPTNLRIE